MNNRSESTGGCFPILFLRAASVAVPVGALLGWLASAAQWRFGGLAVFAGLAAGAVCFADRRLHSEHRIAAAIGASALGAWIFLWISSGPVWRAADNFTGNEVDAMSVRVKALRLCHERQVMGVFDFNDVPEAIRDEARQHVERMTRREKLALLDRTFAARIGRPASEHAGGAQTRPARWVWLLLTLAASASPEVIRQRIG